MLLHSRAGDEQEVLPLLEHVDPVERLSGSFPFRSEPGGAEGLHRFAFAQAHYVGNRNAPSADAPEPSG